VLSADAGASVALGLKPGTDADRIRAAVADHTMEDLMTHVPVSVGDMIFVDAGTVHAIGPGVILLETQQTCDITYRLYDYGRPRELHVEQAILATRYKTAAGKIDPVEKPHSTQLIDQKYFVVDRFTLVPGGSVTLRSTETPQTLVLVEGEASIATGAVSLPLKLGQAAVVPASVAEYQVHTAHGATIVRSVPPLLAV
jgi:mannose-6-phosphate isomerase